MGKMRGAAGETAAETETETAAEETAVEKTVALLREILLRGFYERYVHVIVGPIQSLA